MPRNGSRGARPLGPDVRSRRRVAAGRAAGAGRRRWLTPGRSSPRSRRPSSGKGRVRRRDRAAALGAGRRLPGSAVGIAADENAERSALETRLQELARRIDATLARAEASHFYALGRNSRSRTKRPRDERRDPDCGARSERPRARRELAAAHPDRGGYPLPLAERLAQSEADLHRAVELVTQGCEPQTAAEILL